MREKGDVRGWELSCSPALVNQSKFSKSKPSVGNPLAGFAHRLSG